MTPRELAVPAIGPPQDLSQGNLARIRQRILGVSSCGRRHDDPSRRAAPTAHDGIQGSAGYRNLIAARSDEAVAARCQVETRLVTRMLWPRPWIALTDRAISRYPSRPYGLDICGT